MASGLRYSGVAVALHWATAVLLVGQMALGLRMDGPRGSETFAVFQLHKSVGISILLLTLVRLAWRLAHRPPPLAPGLTLWERRLASGVHHLFYAALIVMPMSGWLLVSLSRTRVPTVLFGLVPWPHLPGTAGLPESARASLDGAADAVHGLGAWLIWALLALHVAGALKHQLVDRDGELGRMVRAPRAWLSPLALILPLSLGLSFAAVLGVRLTASPPAAAPVVAAPPAAPVAPPAAAAVAPAAEPAAPPAPDAATEAPAEPVAWTVDKGVSALGFRSRWSGGAIDGRFTRWTADILFHPDALDRSRVSVTVDMASAATGVSETESALPGSDWFAVAEHPTATFTATRFRRTGGDRYVAEGRLSLRGVSRPLALPFTLAIDGRTARMRAEVALDRLAFGVGQGEWAGTGDVPGAVTVPITLVARSARPLTTGE